MKEGTPQPRRPQIYPQQPHFFLEKILPLDSIFKNAAETPGEL